MTDDELRQACEQWLVDHFPVLHDGYTPGFLSQDCDALLRFAKQQQAVGMAIAEGIVEKMPAPLGEHKRLRASILQAFEAKAKELEA